MTEGLVIYNQTEILQAVNHRSGETKVGEMVQTINSLEELKNSNARFVLLGIPEDFGVRANAGTPGASSAWQASLWAFLNIQSNRFLKGNEVLVLGHFSISEPKDQYADTLRNKVAAIDEMVYPVIEKIVSAGKIPLVIGGGHNNAFPIIKGTFYAFKKPIDVLNIDAHADLRIMEGRHSGNGFTYALHHHYLCRYIMYGLHQNYNNEFILNLIENNKQLKAIFFDDLLKGYNQNPLADSELQTGLEIDLDAVANILSSAETPSGFTLNQIRQFILQQPKKFCYLHICEGAVQMADGRKNPSVAKAISYLLTDFIKTQ